MSVPRKSRKQLVGKAVENTENWEREEEYRTWTRDLNRQWRAVACRGLPQSGMPRARSVHPT